MSVFNRRLWLFLCFMGLTAVFVTAVGAQPVPPPLLERAELPYLPSDAPVRQDPTVEEFDPYYHWSPYWVATVWQEYVDGNWEIVRHYIRLTSHSASDIYPHINPTAETIAFSSNRNGNGYEIHLMGYNGSGQEAITNNTADDIRPVWSPNGRQIAFQSYRDGHPEVYVMNADGSQQTRLTYSVGSGLPAWSPDGKQIVFASVAVNGITYIHIMDKDGQNKRQLAANPSSYPVWSPDGKYIVYSADWDGDGWLDLMLMNPDGSEQRPLYDAPPLTDVWVSSWAPDSESVYFTKIFYIYYQGNWYWTEAQIGYFDLNTGAATNYSPKLVWNWHLQAFDYTPPQISIDQLHEYSSANTFLLSWQGQDFHHRQHPAGIKSYDIQHRTSLQQPWQDWLMETTEETSRYPSPVGQTAYFRMRALDRAGNYSPWLHSSTTFYSWVARGYLTDNRGTPLVQAPFSVSPTPINTTETDNQGHFLFYMKQVGAHLLDVVRQGYGDFVQAVVQQPVLGHLYLPPADNVIVNGEFETAVPLNNWQVGGNLPVTAVDNSYTGQNAVLLNSTTCAANCNQDIFQISSDQPSGFLAVTDNDENIHVIIGMDYRIGTKAGWSTPQPLPDGYSLDQRYLFLVNNELYLLWSLRSGYPQRWWYSTKPADGEWSEPAVFIDTTPPHSRRSIFDIKQDRNGLLYALVRYEAHDDLYHEVYYHQYPDGSWNDGIPTREPSLSSGNDSTKIMVLPDDTVMLFSVKNDKLNTSTLMSDGRWGRPEQLDFYIRRGWENHIVDQQGTVHLLYLNEANELHHITKPLGGNWSYPFNIDQHFNIPNNFRNYRLALDIDDNLHMMRSPSGLTDSLYHLVFDPETGWRIEETIPVDNPLNALYIDQYNNMYRYQSDGNLHTVKSNSSGTASISQTVTIPADMPSPTLSFMMRQIGTAALTVWVDDGTTPTAVPLSTNFNPYWRHAWADLTPWAGQTVTLTFELNQEVGAPFTQMLLDAISLGSAYPDSWVNAPDTLYTQRAQTVQLPIDYGNHSPLDTNDAVLHVSLPDGLNYVSASVEPTAVVDGQLTWQIGDLPAHTAVPTLLITATVASDVGTEPLSVPITLQTAVDERETANNQAHIAVIVRYTNYLPMIMR